MARIIWSSRCVADPIFYNYLIHQVSTLAQSHSYFKMGKDRLPPPSSAFEFYSIFTVSKIVPNLFPLGLVGEGEIIRPPQFGPNKGYACAH